MGCRPDSPALVCSLASWGRDCPTLADVWRFPRRIAVGSHHSSGPPRPEFPFFVFPTAKANLVCTLLLLPSVKVAYDVFFFSFPQVLAHVRREGFFHSDFPSHGLFRFAFVPLVLPCFPQSLTRPLGLVEFSPPHTIPPACGGCPARQPNNPRLYVFLTKLAGPSQVSRWVCFFPNSRACQIPYSPRSTFSPSCRMRPSFFFGSIFISYFLICHRNRFTTL